MNSLLSIPTDDFLPDIGEVLAPLTDAMTFSPGARIFNEAETGTDAYLVESGYVEITRSANGSRQVLAVLGPGEIFGEMAAIDGLARSASATAVHESVLVPISKTQIDDALISTNPLTQLLVRTALGRLRTTQDDGAVPTQPQNQSNSVDAQRRFEGARTAAAQQVRLASELRTALEQDQLELHFQPIVGLADGRVTGAEALLRWRHPERGMVSPAEFIPAAEITGLIVPIGQWVLCHALESFARLQREGMNDRALPTGQFISVNVAPRQLENENSVEELARAVEASDLNPAQVKLEITEQALHDPAKAMAALERLRKTGASIAIDDFGTGFSSLNHLSRYPMDTLKVDQSFVNCIGHDPRGERVVGTILSMARELDMHAVAEGIETEEQFKWLQTHGCTDGQGFLMSRPLPYDRVGAALRTTFRWN